MGSRRRGKWQRLKSGIAAFLALSVAIGACIAAIALGFNLAVVIIISITNRSKWLVTSLGTAIREPISVRSAVASEVHSSARREETMDSGAGGSSSPPSRPIRLPAKPGRPVPCKQSPSATRNQRKLRNRSAKNGRTEAPALRNCDSLPSRAPRRFRDFSPLILHELALNWLVTSIL